MKEVNIISRGNLQGNVTVQGTDEIAQLASGLEHMRQTLVKKEQIEYDLKSAQEKLVLGMSHDLRTPLTGLMAYLEILKKQQKEGAVTQEYINKAFDRILQIRDLSEQMFEYFFVNSRHHIEPVSYTHLDVYKRQSVTCAEESTPDSYVITYSDAKISSKTGVLTVQNRNDFEMCIRDRKRKDRCLGKTANYKRD